MKYIVALDQGTTSSRAVVFDSQARIVASHNIEFPQIYPHPGWVEHRPQDILDSQISSLKLAVEKAGIDPADIAAIGITNQRETTLLWDRATGKPLCNAIVWQCRRTAPLVERLKQDGLGNVLRDHTGLVPDAYFSGTKLQWMLDSIPGSRERAARGQLCFGTVDCFLAWNLTAEHAHVTDATNAARTMLYNIFEQRWDDTLLRAMDIPEALLPRVVDSSAVVGMLDKRILGREIPVAALAGDQHAALFGQGCFAPGMVKNTYGTGCFVLTSAGAWTASPATPWRAACSWAARWSSGCGTRSSSSPPPPRPRPWRPPCRTTTACSSCRPSPAWARPTGTCTAGAPSWA